MSFLFNCLIGLLYTIITGLFFLGINSKFFIELSFFKKLKIKSFVTKILMGNQLFVLFMRIFKQSRKKFFIASIQKILNLLNINVQLFLF